MKTRAAIALVSLALAAPRARAQEHPLFLIHQETAKPSEVAGFEATTKQFAALVSKNKAVMPHFDYMALSSEDFVYTFVARIPNHGGVDSIRQDFGALAQKEGASFGDVMKRGGLTTEVIREQTVSYWPELSYTPAAPRLRREDARFFHYDVYYVMPGHEDEADAVAKDFVALFKSKNLTDGYRLYKSEVGPELPALIVEIYAKDAADYATEGPVVRTAMGEAGRALFARIFAVTRRLEQRDAVLRLDLSPAPTQK
jgi:hypothetical protein